MEKKYLIRAENFNRYGRLLNVVSLVMFYLKNKNKQKNLQQQKTRALSLDSVLIYPEHLLYIKDLHAKKNHFKSKTVQRAKRS